MVAEQAVPSLGFTPDDLVTLVQRVRDRIRVNPDTGCWEWTGAVIPIKFRNGGYGVIGYNQRQRRIHRMVWEILMGSIPSGLESDHLCRNRNCGNPDHLELVTHLENVRRGLRMKGGSINWKKPLCSECGETRVFKGSTVCFGCRQKRERSVLPCGHHRKPRAKRCGSCGRVRLFPSRLSSVPFPTLVRWKAILDLRNGGLTLQAIATQRGVSRQAIDQTVKKATSYINAPNGHLPSLGAPEVCTPALSAAGSTAQVGSGNPGLRPHLSK